MDDIGMDSDYRASAQEICRHGIDPWDCEDCGREMYGGWTHRTCRHGWPAGECPSCYPNDGAYIAGREDVGYG